MLAKCPMNEWEAKITWKMGCIGSAIDPSPRSIALPMQNLSNCSHKVDAKIS
jgi:hypothetical protein